MAYCSSYKIQYVLLLSLLTWLTIKPSHSFHIVNYYRNDNPNSVGEGRIFWNMVGDFIESSPYFPITINVPDIFTSMGDMMSSVYDFFFGGSGGSSDEAEATEETSEPAQEEQNVSNRRLRTLFRHHLMV